MSGKTYASNKQLGLNKHGIKEQIKHKGIVPPSAPRSPHHIANRGGYIKPYKGQVGWRVRCSQSGSQGGFEITVGHHIHKVIVPGVKDQVDFTIDCPETVRVDHIGMLSNDWGALVISRVF